MRTHHTRVRRLYEVLPKWLKQKKDVDAAIVARTRLDAVQDAEDLAKAHTFAADESDDRPWWKTIGPGLITGAADDDPSGVGTYSANGAQFGYTLLWLVPFCIPLMIAVQEMCGRLAAVTGSGLAGVIKAHYPKWVLFSAIGLLILANTFNVYADLNIMAASLQLLIPVPLWVGLIGFSVVMVAGQIIIPYYRYSHVLKWLCLALAGYVVVAFLPGMHNNWGAIGKGLLVPKIKFSAGSILAIVAFLGTTISPYLFFWQAGETVEDEISEENADAPGHRTKPVTKHELRNIKADTAVGMIASQVVAFFILIAAAATMSGKGTDINTAADAAKALAPLGSAAVSIFVLCIIGTGLLAIPTLAGSVAYGLSETFGWNYGLYRRFSRAKDFYLAVAAVIVIGCAMNFIGLMSPVKALVYSAALNGVVAPPLIVLLLLICNNKKIVGDKKNGPWSNWLGWLTVVVMGPAAAYLVYATIAGKV